MERLGSLCKKIRRDIVGLSINYRNGHIASALSCVEILVVLYEVSMREHEDQFILSKGHGALALYAILRHKGYSPAISGHPDMDVDQGIACTTGSLGHGIAIAAGKALAKKLKDEPGTIYVLIGDGECQEGVVWEAMNIARCQRLDNLCVIVDHNGLQALDSIASIADEKDLSAKFSSFGADVIEVDGHDIASLQKVFQDNKRASTTQVVLAHTVKGKGISFMEGVPKWHSRLLDEKELELALKELGD